MYCKHSKLFLKELLRRSDYWIYVCVLVWFMRTEMCIMTWVLQCKRGLRGYFLKPNG